MSQRWLKFLEKFGDQSAQSKPMLDASDLEGRSLSPDMYGRYQVLFHLYGPLPNSAWAPYQCPTLFASIDRCNIDPEKIGLSEAFRADPPDGAWQWLDNDTMVIADVEGGTSIELGVLLMRQGAQLVSTFDHWAISPRMRTADTAIEAEPIINTMFTLASEVHTRRQKLEADAPPVWMCDNRRLGDVIVDPTPGTFDNRYYIDDSILPGVDTLKKGGIRRIVLVTQELDDSPLPDLVSFIHDVHEAGIELYEVGLDDANSWIQPRPLQELPFKTKLPVRSFRRSDLGGFGKMIPQPTEGSYSSGGRGG